MAKKEKKEKGEDLAIEDEDQSKVQDDKNLEKSSNEEEESSQNEESEDEKSEDEELETFYKSEKIIL